jgi:hypothetical protein
VGGLIVDEQLTVRKLNPDKLFCPSGTNHKIIRCHGQKPENTGGQIHGGVIKPEHLAGASANDPGFAAWNKPLAPEQCHNGAVFRMGKCPR